jgi:hypothetical protein
MKTKIKALSLALAFASFATSAATYMVDDFTQTQPTVQGWPNYSQMTFGQQWQYTNGTELLGTMRTLGAFQYTATGKYTAADWNNHADIGIDAKTSLYGATINGVSDVGYAGFLVNPTFQKDSGGNLLGGDFSLQYRFNTLLANKDSYFEIYYYGVCGSVVNPVAPDVRVSSDNGVTFPITIKPQNVNAAGVVRVYVKDLVAAGIPTMSAATSLTINIKNLKENQRFAILRINAVNFDKQPQACTTAPVTRTAVVN